MGPGQFLKGDSKFYNKILTYSNHKGKRYIFVCAHSFTHSSGTQHSTLYQYARVLESSLGFLVLSSQSGAHFIRAFLISQVFMKILVSLLHQRAARSVAISVLKRQMTSVAIKSALVVVLGLMILLLVELVIISTLMENAMSLAQRIFWRYVSQATSVLKRL